MFLHRAELAALWDFTVFLDVDFAVSVPRAVRRNAEDAEDLEMLMERYKKKYVAAQRKYLSSCNPLQKANLGVNYNDFANPTVYK